MLGAARFTDGWFKLRNRLLASPGFQRWAAGFPLTRPIARRRAAALFDLCAGFVYSQVLQACVQLRLFDALLGGPKDVAALGEELGLAPADAARLLDAAAALRLVERRGSQRFGLGVLGAALVGNPGATAMIEHHGMLYADLRDPVGLLRGDRPKTALGTLWPYARGGQTAELQAEDVAAYSQLMSASQPLVAADVLQAYPLRRHRCLLDVGGGDGTFLVQAAGATPGLQLMLLDLPAVVERARMRIAAARLESRTTIIGGDFHTDALPVGADVISLVRVIHDHDDSAALAILQKVWRTLPVGGTLLLAEPMAETAGAAGMEAYFAFYLLAMGSGRPRSAAVLKTFLHQAGFAQVRLRPTRRPMLVQVITAIKGSGGESVNPC